MQPLGTRFMVVTSPTSVTYIRICNNNKPCTIATLGALISIKEIIAFTILFSSYNITSQDLSICYVCIQYRSPFQSSTDWVSFVSQSSFLVRISTIGDNARNSILLSPKREVKIINISLILCNSVTIDLSDSQNHLERSYI